MGGLAGRPNRLFDVQHTHAIPEQALELERPDQLRHAVHDLLGGQGAGVHAPERLALHELAQEVDEGQDQLGDRAAGRDRVHPPDLRPAQAAEQRGELADGPEARDEDPLVGPDVGHDDATIVAGSFDGLVRLFKADDASPLGDLRANPLTVAARIEQLRPEAEAARVRADEAMAQLEPVYEEISGWMSSTAGARNEADLPAKARRYLERLEELIGVPFCLISTGAQRDETILCEESPLTRWYPSVRASLL